MHTIDYGRFLDEAMYVVVHKALQFAVGHGLAGTNHFFISFLTEYPGVIISPRLTAQYPKEMTIVLQHQFSSLIVRPDGFEVSLSFGGRVERLVVPFAALMTFADPSAPFSLQFKAHTEELDTIEFNLQHHNLAKDDMLEMRPESKKNNIIAFASAKKRK